MMGVSRTIICQISVTKTINLTDYWYLKSRKKKRSKRKTICNLGDSHEAINKPRPSQQAPSSIVISWMLEAPTQSAQSRSLTTIRKKKNELIPTTRFWAQSKSLRTNRSLIVLIE
jgi:hypothetical protein